MKQITIIICIICLPCLVNAQQISEYLYNAVPKEYRPANREHITLQELGSLMKNAKWRIIDDEKAIRELDTLCIRFGPIYGSITNKKERAEFLYYLSSYWMGRVDTFLDSVLKYSLIFDLETRDGIKGFEKIAGKVALNEAIVYSDETKEYKKAYDCTIRALDIFHQINDSVEICKSCLQLTDLYSNLGLYKKAGDYLDSANRYETKENNAHIVDYKFNYSAELFLKLFAETKENRFADSLNKLITVCNDTVAYPESSQQFFQNGLYLVKARLHYYQKKYQQSLLDIDTAYKAIEGVAMASYDAVTFKAFKGLNLLQLGKVKEGIAILESVQPDMGEYYTGLMLEEIYNYEKQHGNLARALAYHEKMMEYNAAEQLLKHQGQILELEQQYNVASRDLQITQLKAKENQYKLTGSLIAVILMALLTFIFIYRRNSKRKTQGLVNQIEELTQMQIIQIEEAAKKAEQEERKRIGQDLHDDLGASLAAILQYLRVKTDKETDIKEKADLMNACKILETSYNKTRSKSHDIYYQETDNYFLSTLSNNINLFFSNTDIKVNAEIDTVGMEGLSANLKTTILYTLKEGITNIIKHAKATAVDILFYTFNNTLVLEIADNGTGLSKKYTGKSLGLTSIKERVEKLGGRMEFATQQKGGTVLKAWFYNMSR